jgi:hypothetical protein
MGFGGKVLQAGMASLPLDKQKEIVMGPGSAEDPKEGHCLPRHSFLAQTVVCFLACWSGPKEYGVPSLTLSILWPLFCLPLLAFWKLYVVRGQETETTSYIFPHFMVSWLEF